MRLRYGGSAVRRVHMSSHGRPTRPMLWRGWSITSGSGRAQSCDLAAATGKFGNYPLTVERGCIEWVHASG